MGNNSDVKKKKTGGVIRRSKGDFFDMDLLFPSSGRSKPESVNPAIPVFS
jgi:hypothetical protein